MKIEMRKLSDLNQDPDNARKHDDFNLNSIAASLDKFGQQKPIVISKDGTILAGNGTAQAAAKLGWKELAVVVAPENWDAATAKAFAIADNRSAELATWDNQQLLSTLQELDPELILATGFSDSDIENMLKLWGAAPDLEDLFKEHGDPTDEDGMVRVSFIVPHDVADRWTVAVKSAGSGSPLENTCTAIQAAYDALVDSDGA
jgi:ParB-like chromosome segregation protein Spo0J